MITKIEKLPLLKEFLSSLGSDKTRVAYMLDIEMFYDYINMQQLSIIDVNDACLNLYKAVLASRYELSSVNRKLSSIKTYIKYLVARGVITDDPTTHIKSFKNTNYVATPGLNNDDVLLIIKASKKNPIDHVVCLLLFYLGLRRCEITNLKVSDLVQAEDCYAIKVLGKGNQERLVPITDDILNALSKVCPTQHNTIIDPSNPIDLPLIPSPKNHLKPLHQNSITKIIKRNAKKAGITKNISPHMARVTCVSNALENGASHIQVLELGGWKTLEMVARYDRRRKLLKNSAVHKVSYNKNQGENT